MYETNNDMEVILLKQQQSQKFKRYSEYNSSKQYFLLSRSLKTLNILLIFTVVFFHECLLLVMQSYEIIS